VRELIVTIPASLWPAALSLGWPTVHRIAEAADAADADVQQAVLDALRTEETVRRWRSPNARGQPP